MMRDALSGEVISTEHNGSRLLKLIHTRHPEYHPALALADLAHKIGIEDELALKCHAELLSYIEPKLKSIEIKVDDPNNHRTIRVSLFEALEGEFTSKVTDSIPDTIPLPRMTSLEGDAEEVIRELEVYDK